MPVVHPMCWGIDGHAAQLTACRRRGNDEGQLRPQGRDFGTPYDQLLALRAGLDEHGCPSAVLESPGGYGQPLSHGLGAPLEIVVAQARSVRQRPGTKTDQADAAWLAELLAPGLVEPSCSPPPALPAWRDLPRTRVALVQTRPQVPNRIRTL